MNFNDIKKKYNDLEKIIKFKEQIEKKKLAIKRDEENLQKMVDDYAHKNDKEMEEQQEKKDTQLNKGSEYIEKSPLNQIGNSHES